MDPTGHWRIWIRQSRFLSVLNCFFLFFALLAYLFIYLSHNVKVVARIRAVNDVKREGGDGVVRKLSSNSVSIGDRKFNFDSVLDSNSNQVQYSSN